MLDLGMDVVNEMLELARDVVNEILDLARCSKRNARFG